MSRVPEPADPDFRTRVKTSFSRQAFMATLGASLERIVPASAPQFLARGRVLRPGRRLSVCLAEVVALGGQDQEVIATMLSTISVRPGGGGPGPTRA